MGSLFRSEKMTMSQLFLQSESAYFCIRELGELGKVQFRDLNPEVNAFQRKFTNEVRRCDEMERRLRFLRNHVEKSELEIGPCGFVEAPDPQEMLDLEGKFELLEGEMKEINGNKETLKKNLMDLIELQHILHKTHSFFREAETTMMGRGTAMGTPKMKRARQQLQDENELLESISGGDETDIEIQKQQEQVQTRFTFVTGVIARERVPTFERVLWRACRGNVFLRQTEIEGALEDPTTGNRQHKVVFILFFQGDMLRSRVRKICEGFRATLYQCPETAQDRREMTSAVAQRISDLQSVLDTTEEHSLRQLTEVAKDLKKWETQVTKIKGIYHTMNMFNLDMTHRCLIAECWCPIEGLEEIQVALSRGTERSGSNVPSILNKISTDEKPPTYNKVNKFTRGFQAIVDSYGVATYEEVNPAPYTIITFPFLFAVMFGDAGHGLIMASFALGMILFEKKLAGSDTGGEMFMTMFDGRYIVLLMGLFSIYTGLIYNDVFAKSLNIFGSSWDAAYTEASLNIQTDEIGDCCPGFNISCVIMGAKESELTTFPRESMTKNTPYPFGLDPIWNVAENKLIFTNSYKMKMAVILGIFQMLFGVILSIFNHMHFKKYINIVVEFIPQVLFLLCIFGWLVFTIVYKWCLFYENPNTAPSLLITLINMFLEFGSSPAVNATEGADVDDNEYSVFGPTEGLADVQRYIQLLLVITAVACVPWMLCIKPYYLMAKHKRQAKEGGHLEEEGTSYDVASESLSGSDDDKQILPNGKQEEKKQKQGEHGEGDEFDFGEVFVHQAIHTIEYCLGTISNTASYLRLWALSLAHAELSEVLWTMVLSMGPSFSVTMGPAIGAISIFVLFAFWACMTIGILLVMEGLSAFLHALRLHWVEFQNKFYEGNGYKFRPFSFESILKGEEDF